MTLALLDVSVAFAVVIGLGAYVLLVLILARALGGPDE